jgi:hypothetical protein
MGLDTIQESGLGRRFGEFILLVSRGHYDGTQSKARLLGETGLSVEAGDLTSAGQALILREWMHPRRGPGRTDPEEHPAT